MALYGGGGGGTYEDRFAGGGFMSQQQEQGGAGSGGKGRSNKEQTLRAVTIRQLVKAAAASTGDSDLVVDGADLTNVTIVGKVVSSSERTGNIDLQVSDGTGTVGVVYFGEGFDDPAAVAQKLAELRPGTYVRVYGHLRAFSGAWSVNAFAVRLVHDFNEITYHCLQAVFQHLHLAKGAGAGGGAPAQQQGGFGGHNNAPVAGGWHGRPLHPFGQQQGGGGNAPVAAGAGGMDPCAAAVLQIISDPNAGDAGVHVNDICGRLGPRGMSRRQVDDALQFLQNEAHAYTTCDENHWRST